MDVIGNLNRLEEHIAVAARRAGRNPGEIKLVAVTKTVPVEIIREALACGANRLGENRVQEFLSKYQKLPPSVEWHMIGHLQTNKVNKIIGKVNLIHSLDRWALAEELHQAATEVGKVVKVLVQVNVAGEKSKYGLAPSETVDFITSTADLAGLSVEGLMTIAPWSANPEEVRPVFRQLKEIARKVEDKVTGSRMDYLSMGMSGDWEVAVEEGANILRIGTAIFGERDR
ncbi:MAG: YggS family pyridoxal phosphate-dependent enzyme [Desulfotomaculaceae bacterium]|nr:YggS family pyridoxal phosphate-dependent enzyme [Desulfotomaculaceae bacterium]